MICPECHGTGYDEPIAYPAAHMAGYKLFDWWFPLCRECGGSGRTHCCDGLVEQPDTAEDDLSHPR